MKKLICDKCGKEMIFDIESDLNLISFDKFFEHEKYELCDECFERTKSIFKKFLESD